MSRAFVLLFALAACASPSPAEDDPGLVVGTVVSVDLTPMTYDGDAIVVVQTASGEATVTVPARVNLCQAEGLGLVGELRPGDGVEVRGARTADGTLTPCSSADHRLVRTSTAALDVEASAPGETRVEAVRGVYASGFETSAFRPCDRPDEAWWLDGDAAFDTQFNALSANRTNGASRGRVGYVEATVSGTLSAAGQHGHLGQYAHRLTVDETTDMVRLEDDGQTVPRCR